MNTNLLDLNNDVLNIIGDNENKIKRGDITFNEYVEIFHVCDYSAYIKHKEFYLFTI